ncbi:MAG: hypothetical protein K2X82_25160 [Gemmataceae bacterium]|nr:hypothetical protein [Gemmataceae bacterium]
MMCCVPLYLTLTLAVPAVPAPAAPDPDDLFAHCRNADPLPDGLREAYTKFVKLAREGKPEDACLPESVKITDAHRPDGGELGRDINLPFLQKQFHAPVDHWRSLRDGCVFIRTGSSGIYFVRTADKKWLIYQYFDKPIA